MVISKINKNSISIQDMLQLKIYKTNDDSIVLQSFIIFSSFKRLELWTESIDILPEEK